MTFHNSRKLGKFLSASMGCIASPGEDEIRVILTMGFIDKY